MNPSTSRLLCLFALLWGAPLALAQTGVDDDRVSLPEGPGSLEGVGDDVELDPNMGYMSHAVAIELPKGFAGASPGLQLSYASAAGSGPVGIGWSMGVPSIERMTSRGVPEYDAEDLFDAGGQELVQVSSEGETLLYRARYEKGFSRYRWVDVGGGADGYWVEEMPDGSRSYYGADATGATVESARRQHPTRGTAAYHLVEQVDVYGNAARYSYSALDGTVPLLTGITWLEDGDGQPVYAVEIDYESRPDPLSDATRGFEELTANRVRFIRVMQGPETIREFVLTYEDDATAGGFSRLARVERYGLGGRLGGPLYEIVHSFSYSQALGVSCEGAGCDRPDMVEMGSGIGGASNFSTGRATLLDINTDGLPDIVDTTDTGAHRFYLGTLTPDGSGGFTHTFSEALPSASDSGRGAVIQLGAEVQTFDVNGDGASDLLNRSTGQFLSNAPGLADWGQAGTFADVSALQSLDLSAARFIDLDDDKRVDLITSSSTTTTFYRNTGDSFAPQEVSPLGVAIQADSLVQFADMNGDGLSDPVELRADGSVRYRLNLGRGDWSEWRNVTGLSLTTTQRPLADLEDINGDGISDVVIAGSGLVEYALNRSGDGFDPIITIDSSDIDGTIPDRGTGVTVFYADMNANGSDDVVWIRPGGVVQYLELFPVRPNLLTRIENGIGSVQKITYTTAAQEAAEARDAGEPWAHHLSIPMQLVKRVDRYVTLTGSDDGSGLHEITLMTYRDGFYDGDEKQYRGFERVEQVVEGDAYQEEATTRFTFDVGRARPHHNGLALEQTVLSDGEPISSTFSTYEDCDLAEVPTPEALLAEGRMAVFFPCQAATEIIHKEREGEDAWRTVRTEMTYDGYGNVALQAALGDVDVEGDELYTETDHVTPDTTWLLRLKAREQVYAAPSVPEAERAETRWYYDGEGFVGLPEGQATHGFVSRATKRVDATGAVIQASRARRDAFGNAVETLDPNGSIEEATAHRRTYTYDDTGLFLIRTDLALVDAEGAPYTLRRDSRYERNFQKPVEVSVWYLVRDGVEETARDADQLRYDAFGRPSERYRPGDQDGTPSVAFTYELGDPFTRVVIERRSVMNGPRDEDIIVCLDGKGRTYQSRNRIEAGRYQVDRFTAYNARGSAVEVAQPYLSDTDQCETAPPSDALRITFRYDALQRLTRQSSPGDAIYGEPVVEETLYRPLATEVFDAEDLTPGEHQGTPTITTRDGLGRVVSFLRTAREDGELVSSGQTFFYDDTGSFAGYEDAEGHRLQITTDLMGRNVEVSHPDFGTTRMLYDDASHLVARTDARGVTVRFVYDGQNRVVERFEEGSRDATLVTWHYDALPEGCALTECTNLAGQLAAQRYPVDLGGGRVEAGVDRFGYDARRRRVFSGRRLGLLADLVTRVEHDNQNRVTRIIHPDGTEIQTDFDAIGRISAVPGFVERVEYTDRNRPARLVYANAASASFRYDALMRLEGIQHQDGLGETLHDLSLSYNRADIITSLTDAVSAGTPSLSATFELDDWYRSTGVSFEEERLSYDLDPLDRVLSATSSDPESPAQRGEFSYAPESAHQLASAAGLTFEYDSAGSLTRRGGASFARDEMGRIARVERGGEESGRHLYAEIDRVAQLTRDGTLVLYGFERFEVRDGVAHTYIEALGPRDARHASTDLAASIYPDAVADGEINAGDAYLARAQGDLALSTEHVLAASAARLLAEQEDREAFFHSDHLGSLLSATDAGGELRGRRGYYPFGGLRFSEGFVDAHGFTGQEQDATTGLLHMRHRDLDPVTGRWDRFDPAFMSPVPDSITASPGEATTGYAYVGHRLSTSNDPSGLKSKYIKEGGRIIGKMVITDTSITVSEFDKDSFSFGPEKTFKRSKRGVIDQLGRDISSGTATTFRSTPLGGYKKVFERSDDLALLGRDTKFLGVTLRKAPERSAAAAARAAETFYSSHKAWPTDSMISKTLFESKDDKRIRRERRARMTFKALMKYDPNDSKVLTHYEGHLVQRALYGVKEKR